MSPVRPGPDLALLAILASNGLTLAMALLQGWGLLLLLWPFWIQSMVIGWFARRRILALQDYCAEGVLFNGRPLAPGGEGKLSVANFFAMHFGLFHLVYFLFLLAFTVIGWETGVVPFKVEGSDQVIEVVVGRLAALDYLFFAALGIAFWQTHGLSHRQHLAVDLAGRPKIGSLMFLPYLRVLPMHFMIILGVFWGGQGWAVVWFVLLKTIADVGMHYFAHAQLRLNVSIGED